ncbi:citron Rho-interacting kinase-like isoform X2 [Dreissena polymorpha]|uniref:Mitochondria-eating protein C-terminal domain-containing protein n=1 Tax=Dreissena polymorpha TaxID=45954 RepID=A0A9D4KNQ1_DREPO|nr:citron Rho-interacting kinase-like isoform X2 [Dreissena polymorpha]KAH3843307.1 hypothetical protein DPMN_116821 [Dreissena polymorpha]
MADEDDTGTSALKDNPQDTIAVEDVALKAHEQLTEEWVHLKQSETQDDTQPIKARSNDDEYSDRTETRENALPLSIPDDLLRLVDDLMSRLIKLENQDRRISKLEDLVKGIQSPIEVKEDLDKIEIETGRTDGALHKQDNLQSEDIEKVPPRLEEFQQIQNLEERIRTLEDLIRPQIVHSDVVEKIDQNDMEIERIDGTLNRQEQLNAEEIKILRQWIQETPWQIQFADQRGINNRIKELETEMEKVTKERDNLKSLNAQVIPEVKHLRKEQDKINRENNELNETINLLKNDLLNNQKALKTARKQLSNTERILDDSRRTHNHMKAELEEKVASLEKQLNTLTAERDDLKNRYSKLAGHKLTDQNPDIADLSDPNRAMKLSERFGTLYDDEWTNAFEELSDKLNVEKQEAVTFLLRCLHECWTKSQDLASDWMAALNNAFIFPIQNPEPNQDFADVRRGEGLGSKELRAIRDARRLIGPHVADMVKQHCLTQICQDEKEKLAACKPYLESCAEICWLMALADPPLYVDFTAQQGDAFDSTRYTVYEKSGTTIHYLVWPPLYASKGGGLLSKGTAATLRTIERSDHDNA